jgi:hypothetical protein
MRQRIDRSTGKYDRYCGSVRSDDAPCSHLVVEGERYVYSFSCLANSVKRLHKQLTAGTLYGLRYNSVVSAALLRKAVAW